MSYTKKDWQSGDTITAVALNNMENGIEKAISFDAQDLSEEQKAQARKNIGVSEGTTGKDGVSATHEWNGTVLTITSASGTSSADLKGEKGDKGDKGDPGEAIASAVLYTAQTLTDEQKAQARTNIGVVSEEIPYFDLANMGLPAIIPGEGNVEVENVDLTDLKEALANGPVKLRANVNIGTIMAIECVVNAITIVGTTKYQAISYAYFNGVYCGIFVFDTNSIRAQMIPQTSYLSAGGVSF